MENTAEKAYSEILKVLKKYKDVHIFDINDLERKAKHHLFGIELKEKYGLNIDPKDIHSLDCIRIDTYKFIGWYGEEYDRKISWPIDERQPVNELLFQLGFSTGAFIFGDGSGFNKEYPVDFFQKFWLELKSYNPDYIDEVNKDLYWNIKNAKEIFNSFEDILKKYHDLNKEDIKQRRIKKMEEDLEKLKKSK